MRSLALALALCVGCRTADIDPPDVYFDPIARARLPDGGDAAVVSDAGVDAAIDATLDGE